MLKSSWTLCCFVSNSLLGLSSPSLVLPQPCSHFPSYFSYLCCVTTTTKFGGVKQTPFFFFTSAFTGSAVWVGVGGRLIWLQSPGGSAKAEWSNWTHCVSRCWHRLSAGPPPACPLSSRQLAQVFSALSAAFPESKAHCTVTHQISTCVMFFDILLAKASHKAKLKVSVARDYTRASEGSTFEIMFTHLSNKHFLVLTVVIFLC